MIADAGFVQRQGRADARRAGRDHERLEDLTAARRPSLAPPEMGPDAGAARRAAGHRARSVDPARRAPPVPRRPLRPAHARRGPIMPPPCRRSARRRSSSARRWRPVPIWSARMPLQTSCSCRTICRPPRSRRSRRSIEARARRPGRAILFVDRRRSRSAPPPSPRSTAPSPPKAATSPSRCCARASRTNSPAPSRPMNGRRPMSS